MRCSLRIILYYLKRDLKSAIKFKVNTILSFLSFVFNIAVLLIVALIARNVLEKYLSGYGGDYLIYLMIGIVAYDVLNLCQKAPYESIYSAFGTRLLEALRLLPVKPHVALAGLSIGSIASSALRIIAYIVVGAVIGAYVRVSLSQALLCILFLAIGAICYLGLGFIAASMFFLIQAKSDDPVNWLSDICVYVASGLYYPVSVLPAPLQWLSCTIPHTYVFDALRKILTGNAYAKTLPVHFFCNNTVIFDLCVLILYAIILVPLGLFLLDLGFRKSRMDGRLSWWT